MPGWDYARGGKYFITIKSFEGNRCFGDVMSDEMYLNEIGIIADSFWKEIPDHFDNTYLDEFVVMPNHIHGIIVMKRSINNDVNTGEDVARDVGSLHATNQHPKATNQHPKATNQHAVEPKYLGHRQQFEENLNQGTVDKSHLSAISPKCGSLATIIRSFKSACTIEYNKIGFEWYGWQPKYHDRIIRDDLELGRIRTYIRNNPSRWKKE